MVTTVQVYRASDGEVFGDEAAALLHESGLKNKAKIDTFLNKHYPAPEGKKSGPARSIAGKAITLFLAEST
jgi:hypothetical protein